MAIKKIAILAPPVLPVKHDVTQGGIELICYYQSEGLVKAGYDVTLYAAPGSTTSAHLKTISKVGIADYKIDPSEMESSRKLRLESVLIGQIYKEVIKNKYDLIFNHLRGGEAPLLLSKFIKTPIVTILHLPLFEEMADFFRNIKAPLISISNNQRLVAPNLNYVATVYNGIDIKDFPFNNNPQDYLLNITTIGRHKNQLSAILAAKKLNMRLILAGKVRDQDYFDQEIKPHVDNDQIIYKGVLDFSKKIELYKNAKAFVFPIQWEEPFGLVMIEAMACGTPVVAFDRGAVKEVIEHKRTGYVVDFQSGVDGLVQAIKEIDRIDRSNCRRHVENNFTMEKVTQGYIEVIKSMETQ